MSRIPDLAKVTKVVAGVPGQVNSDALMRAARRAAGVVRVHATRNHSAIGIRIATKEGRVRVTITGRDAQRYRAQMQAELKRSMPDALHEIHEQIARRPK